MKSFLGYDPGGRDAKGVALLQIDGAEVRYVTALVDSVDGAMAWFHQHLRGGLPTAIGIDTYMYWETTRGGWRAADLWLRERYPTVRDSIFCSNSAYGSMSVQGMALAIEARLAWPDASLTEAHPKVLFHALTNRKYAWPGDMGAWLLRQIGCMAGTDLDTDHQWDALLAAWAAAQGHAGNWALDLRQKSHRTVEPAGAVKYWWPG